MPHLGKLGQNRSKIEFCERVFTLRGSNALVSRKKINNFSPNIDDREFREFPHCECGVEITVIHSHAFLAKIS